MNRELLLNMVFVYISMKVSNMTRLTHLVQTVLLFTCQISAPILLLSTNHHLILLSEEKHALIDYLVIIRPEKEVIILGDFNQPSLEWHRDGIPQSSIPTNRLFLDTFLSLGQSQLVKECAFPQSGNTGCGR